MRVTNILLRVTDFLHTTVLVLPIGPCDMKKKTLAALLLAYDALKQPLRHDLIVESAENCTELDGRHQISTATSPNSTKEAT